MQPYYEHNGITIYHADARDVIEWITADVCLTDTPYGIDGAKGHINKERGKGNYTPSFKDDRENVERVIVPIIQRLINRLPCVVVTPGNKNLDLYPQSDSFGVFYQPAAVGLQTFGNLDAQPILYYGKNMLGRNMGVPCSYRLTEAPPKVDHPCPKPRRAWKTLLSNIAKPGMTIIDPFVGSGTTLQVAKELGMNAIGVDIEEKYCELAAQSLSQEVMELV